MIEEEEMIISISIIVLEILGQVMFERSTFECFKRFAHHHHIINCHSWKTKDDADDNDSDLDDVLHLSNDN